MKSNWNFLLLHNIVQLDISCYCAILCNWKYLLLHNTVQLKISCYCAILCNWKFLAIAQYCAIEDFLLLLNTVQLKISCYCTILNIIILDPDLNQLENWAHNQKSKYMFRFSISKKPKNSIFVKIKLSLILDPLDFNVDQFENGTKN